VVFAVDQQLGLTTLFVLIVNVYIVLSTVFPQVTHVVANPKVLKGVLERFIVMTGG
jgi:hypothetical protein